MKRPQPVLDHAFRLAWERPMGRRAVLAGATGLCGALTLPLDGRRWAVARQDAAATPKPGGTLRLADSIDATDVDPQKSNEIYVFYAYVEGLTSIGDGGEVLPLLATEWQASPDAREYTFRLRERVPFHSGREVTADDVKWSLDRIKDPATVAQRGNDLRNVTVEVVDPLTVRLTLDRPNAAVPALMASCFVLAPESVGADGIVAEPIGTGPFVFQSWRPEQEIRCRRNPSYWQEGQPYLDEIVYQIIPDPVARLTALRSGTIDVAANFAATDLPLLAGDESIVTQLTTANIAGHLSFNMRQPKPPLDDVRVRRAIALALNKAELVVAAVGEGGPGQVNNQLWSEGHFWRLAVDDPFAEPNLDEARRLLAEAGVADGFAADLLTVFDGRPPAEVIQAQLRRIGIEAEVDYAPDFTSYVDRLQRDDYAMLYDSSYPRDDPAYTFTFFESTNPSNTIYYGSYANPAVDALLAEAVATLDVEARKRAYAAALSTIQNEDVANVFVLSRQAVWGSRSDVRGFTPGRGPLHRTGGGLAQTWLSR
jgi:peptide/nickel transport system substrate-binding protein